MRRRLRAVAAMSLAALAPFALAELGLRAAGWRPAPDPLLADFDGHAPIFERAGDEVRVAAARRRIWRAEPFPASPAPGALRAFAVGDSVTWGHRGNEFSGPLAAWPEQLQGLLRRRQPGAPHLVVNCGARTFASNRVPGVVREVLDHAPDVVVAYFGSSEHLEGQLRERWRARERSLPAWLRPLRVLEALAALVQRDPPGLSLEGLRERDEALRSPFLTRAALLPDPAARARLLENAQRNLDAIADACRARGVPLVVATVPSHLRFPPFATRYSSEAARERGEAAVRRAGELVAAGRAAEAVALLAPLRDAEPDAAALHYRLGQAHDRTGDLARARAAYLAARDTDACPLRALGEFNERVRRLAARPGVVVADVERRFEQAVPDGVPDERLFLDGSHPTEPAHALVAEELHRAMEQAGLLPAAAPGAGAAGAP